MNGKKIIIVIAILWIVVFSCREKSNDSLILRKVEVDSDYELDTLETFENDSILIVNVLKLGALGKFSIALGSIIRFEDRDVVYEALDFSPFILSDEHVSKQKVELFGKTDWGWYNAVGDGTFKPLPYEEEYKLEIERQYPQPKYFVNSNNTGEYFVYEDGKLIRTINYGNILLKDTNVNFMKLDSKILELKDNCLIKKNNINVDEILLESQGLFFISKTGRGVLKKVQKKRIIELLNVIRLSREIPNSIEIR